MNYMRVLFTVFTIISLVSFGQINKTERLAEPDIYNVKSNDKEMNEAIKKSRLTFDNFLTTFKNQKRYHSSFCIKMPFATSYGVEHIWLVNIESKDGKLFGQVANLPEEIKNIKFGDKIEIDRNEISDWFYIERDKLIGGLTIRVIRDRMTPNEKKQFDREYGVSF